MLDGRRQSTTGDLVDRLPPTTEKYEIVAEQLREDPPNWWRKLPLAPTADAAKSLAYRIREGRSAAFRPSGHYDASSKGRVVEVTYLGPPNSERAAACRAARRAAVLGSPR